jgi:hypothetical protein
VTNDKLEKDYKNFNQNIENMAEEEIQKIQKKIKKTEKEAQAIGDNVECMLRKCDVSPKKKVNTK